MPRILVGSYFQETNDFHPNDTVYEDFSVRSGADLINDTGGVMGGALNVFSQRSDVEVIPPMGRPWAWEAPLPTLVSSV